MDESHKCVEDDGIAVTITVRIGKANPLWVHNHYSAEFMGPAERELIRLHQRQGDLGEPPKKLVAELDAALWRYALAVLESTGRKRG